MYFPSPLPTTRLSVSTSALPVGPAPPQATRVYKTPGRPAKGKFKDSLGGLLEEEGEEIIAIASGPDPDADNGDDDEGDRPAGGRSLWAALGREEFSVWATRVRLVLLRSHSGKLSPTKPASSSPLAAQSRPRQAAPHPPLAPHARLQRLALLPRTVAHRRHHLDGAPPAVRGRARRGGRGRGQEGRRERGVCPAWGRQGEGAVAPRGGRGHGAAGDCDPRGRRARHGDWRRCRVVRRSLSLSLAVSRCSPYQVAHPRVFDTRSVCVTPSDLLVALQDPPILRIVPFPSSSSGSSPHESASSSTSRLPTFGKPVPAPAPPLGRRASGWEALPAGMGAGEGTSDAVTLSEWEWLVGRDRSDGASPRGLSVLPYPFRRPH